MNKSLTVYKASAGSGKTFTLAVEYIKLLIKDPHCYRKILAVTFTNKATEEMKMRILSQLYGIWKKLPDSASYVEKVCGSLGVDSNYASQQAGVALYNLLHNYNYFRIETIDSFFQSILRNLARELDLTTNLRLGLNDKQVEEQAVDKLIENLDGKNEVLYWIIDYIKEKISNDRSWNVINEIKGFGLTIFNDKYKDSSKELDSFVADKDNYERYVKLLKNESDQALKAMRSYGEMFMKAIEAQGLDANDFKYGKTGVYSFFAKLVDGEFSEDIVGKRVMDCHESTDNWYTKKSANASLVSTLVNNVLYSLLDKALKDRPKLWKRYMSAQLTLRHLNHLRLLSIIGKQVRQLNNEANRFMLSDTQHLLQSLIEGTDSPFIFEKIGSHLSHIMIDEFQDTSTVQWQNFKVLLLECMSQEDSHNLIVGDVKQSIYRWRSGDWRLLNNISNEFGNNKKLINHVSLDKNYRSQRNIINFNNAFFAAVKSHEDIDEIKSAYSDVHQDVPEGKGCNGYVKVELLAKDDYMESTLERIKQFVVQLIDNGIKQSEIAILVRVNTQIELIADYLQSELHDKDVNIVSDEAFRLESSTAVNILVNALHLLIHPEDNLVKATLVCTYQSRIMKSGLTDSELLNDGDNLDKWLPEAFTTQRLELLKMPLFELCQHILALFDVYRLKSEGCYISTFNDKLRELISERSADITLLLKEWEENYRKVSIQGTEVDGIRLLSIHKSKGLEFENVIIPFCDWELEKTTLILCKTDEMPYGELPLIPLDYNSKMKDTVYNAIYEDEHSQNMVDNLNLLYVAFTRAVSNLYVIGKRSAKSTRSELIEACIDKVCTMLQNASLTENGNEGSLVFEYGNIYKKDKEHKEESINVFLQPSAKQDVNITTGIVKAEFRQSNDSIRFTNEDDSEGEQGSYIKMGLVMHEILSRIKTIDDVDKVLDTLEQDGVLYDEVITNSKIKSMLKHRLESQKVAHWFSDEWDVINETSILSKNPTTGKVEQHRPDRVIVKGSEAVVIDFKFGKQKQEYREQVRQYMDLLMEMGYGKVSGCIWYVYSNKIEEV